MSHRKKSFADQETDALKREEETPECLNVGPTDHESIITYRDDTCYFCDYKDGCKWYSFEEEMTEPEPPMLEEQLRAQDEALREHEALLRESESLFVLIDETFKGDTAERTHVLCEVRSLYAKIKRHLSVGGLS